MEENNLNLDEGIYYIDIRLNSLILILILILNKNYYCLF